jgi:hypothetical protein
MKKSMKKGTTKGRKVMKALLVVLGLFIVGAVAYNIYEGKPILGQTPRVPALIGYNTQGPTPSPTQGPAVPIGVISPGSNSLIPIMENPIQLLLGYPGTSTTNDLYADAFLSPSTMYNILVFMLVVLAVYWLIKK